MAKVKSVALLLFFICSLIFLGTVNALGIPFLGVPSLFDREQMNFSRDFSQGYEIDIRSDEKTLNTVLARVDAMPYEGVEISPHPDNTSTLYLPKQFGAAAEAIASTVCAAGKITFTDSDGAEVISRTAIQSSSVGLGRMDPNSSELHYYLEFSLNPSFRSVFYEATEALANKRSEGKNILYVCLDGAEILKASIDAPMTEDSFMIGGSFPDATLPTLYAAFVNGGSFDSPLSYGDVVVASAAFGDNGFHLCLLSLLGAAFILCTLTLFFGRFAYCSNLACDLVFLTLGFAIYQICKIHLSFQSILGFFFGLLFLFAVQIIVQKNIQKAAKTSKPIEASVSIGTRSSVVLLFFLHTVFTVACAVTLALTSSQPSFFETLIPLLIATIFSAVASLLSPQFWHAVFSSFRTLNASELGIGKSPSTIQR